MLESRAPRGTSRSLDTDLRASIIYNLFTVVSVPLHKAKEDYMPEKKVADLDWPRTDSTLTASASKIV